MIRLCRLRFAGLSPFFEERTLELPDVSVPGPEPLLVNVPEGGGADALLDALCLSLFGKDTHGNVPARPDQKQSSVPALFAELTFCTDNARYRCCWRRTDTTDDHRLVDLSGSRPPAVGVGAVGRALAALGFGDIEQFTHSTVLRAESLLDILGLSPAARLAVLEQRGGSDIYARAAAAVHERVAALRTSVDTLQNAVARVTVLDEPRELRLRDRLDMFRSRARKADARQRELSEALVRLDLIARTEHECAQTESRLSALAERREECRPGLERLRRARLAEELRSSAPPIARLRADCDERDRAVHELEQQRDRQESVCAEVREHHETAQAELRGAYRAREQEIPAIGKARELDEGIRLLSKHVNKLDRRAAELGTERAKLLNRITRTERARDQAVVGRKREKQYLTTHERDARLGTELTGITRAFESLAYSHTVHQASRRELDTVARKREEAAAEYARRQREHERAAKELEQTQQNRTRMAASLERLLGRRSLAEWQEGLAESKQQRDLLSRIDGWLSERSAEQQRYEQLERAHRDRRETHDRLLSEERTLLGKAQHAERSRGRGTQSARMANEAGGTEAERVIRDLSAMHEKLCALRVERKGLEADISHADTNLQDIRDRLTALEQSIQDGLRRSHLPTDLRTAPYRVRTQNAAVEREIRLATETISRARQLQNQEHDAAERVDAAQQAERNVHTELLLARRELDAAEHARTHMTKRQEQAAQREMRMEKEVADLVKPYAVRAIAVGRLDAILKQLARRRDDWRTHDEKHDEHAERQKALDGELTGYRLLLERIDDDTASVARDTETSREELNRLERLRRQTLGDRDPDTEQSRLESAVTAAERTCAEARQKENRVARELAELEHRLHADAESLEEARRQAEAAETDYLGRVRQKGFADIADVDAAVLPAQESAELAEQEKSLQDEHAALEEKLLSLRGACAVLRTDRPSQELAQLEHQLASTGTRLTRAREAAGVAKQRLNRNQSAQAQRRRLDAELEARREECARCETLERLMGGPDGCRYRALAVQDSHSVVLEAANRYLRCLSERYLFAADTDTLSPLSVVDTWNLAERQPVAQLSRTDSILAGFALTLGFAMMTRRRVPIRPLLLADITADLDTPDIKMVMESLARLCRAGIPIVALTGNEMGARCSATADVLLLQATTPAAAPAPRGAAPDSGTPSTASPAGFVEPDGDADILAVVEQEEDPLEPRTDNE